MKHNKYLRQLKKFGNIDKFWSGYREVNNHTFPYALTELKPVARKCELTCDKMVENQRIQYQRVDWDIARWITKCDTCGLYQDPRTGEMVDHRCLNKYFMRKKRGISEQD